MKVLTFINVGNVVIAISFPCEKFKSGAFGNGKDDWNVALVGDGEVRSDPFDSLLVSNDDIMPTDMVEDDGGTMLSAPGTRVLNVVEDVIYVEVTGSLSKWDTHFFLVDIQSPGIKKVVICLKDTVDTVLPAERQCTIEEEALKQVEETSTNLQAAHAALWKAYEGTIGIQDTFTRVTVASNKLDAVRNKLSLLRDSKDSLKRELDGTKDVIIKVDPAVEDATALQFQPASASPCRLLPRCTGNPNPLASSTKPWAYYVIPFDPIDIPTQRAKRKAPIDTSTGSIPKHAKLETSD
ncbi:hypothetical protein EDD15DRAFT_2197401 [Pisolithus albus]|nr:hypothetical protein EDD15DRAFT_2197401 [Pisolithus albus]